MCMIKGTPGMTLVLLCVIRKSYITCETLIGVHEMNSQIQCYIAREQNFSNLYFIMSKLKHIVIGY